MSLFWSCSTSELTSLIVNRHRSVVAGPGWDRRLDKRNILRLIGRRKLCSGLEVTAAKRADGHQPHIVAKHMYSATAAIPPKTYVGQIGKVDFGAGASGQVVKAPAPNTTAATPHAAERPVRPSSFATCSAYRRANPISVIPS